MEFCVREFIAGLRRKKREQIAKFVKLARQRYVNELNQKPNAVALLQRASARFATVYAAGMLAIWLGVLDWDRDELRNAILKCQLDGLAKSDVTTKDSAISAMETKLVDYIKRNQAKFVDLRKGWLDPKAHKFGAVPGYVARHKGKMYWYLTAAKLKSIIGPGSDASCRSKVDALFTLDISQRFCFSSPSSGYDRHHRVGDLVQLEQIASGYKSRQKFLTELSLDPPEGTAGKGRDQLTPHQAREPPYLRQAEGE